MTDLRLREIRVDRQKRSVSCIVSYPDVNKIGQDVRGKIVTIVRESLPRGYSCTVKFANDNFTVASFNSMLAELIKRRYPIFGEVNKNTIETVVDGRNISSVLVVSETVARNMEAAEFVAQIDEYFRRITCYNVSLSVRSIAVERSSASEQKRLVQLALNKELLKPSRHFSVNNVEKFIGKAINAAPMFISDIRGEMDSCVVCGKVSDKSLKASHKNPNLHICRFVLTDGSDASIDCVLFVRFQITDVNTLAETAGDADVEKLSQRHSASNDKLMKKLMTLYDGAQVLVRGRIERDKFRGSLEMYVYDMCKCTIADSADSARKFRSDAPAEYLTLQPEDCSELKQLNFIDGYNDSSVLSDKTVVVLHANVTGSKPAADKIVAICAVKLVGGHPHQLIYTLVNPEEPVDSELLDACHATADQLAFCPTLTEIVSDVYKFVHGCTLYGNNLDVIVGILNYYAAPLGYRFDNTCDEQNNLFVELTDDGSGGSFVTLAEMAKRCKVKYDGSNFCKSTALTVARCVSFLVNSADK